MRSFAGSLKARSASYQSDARRLRLAFVRCGKSDFSRRGIFMSRTKYARLRWRQRLAAIALVGGAALSLPGAAAAQSTGQGQGPSGPFLTIGDVSVVEGTAVPNGPLQRPTQAVFLLHVSGPHPAATVKID